ncbi:MAG: Gfo/Idh/MocA family oxidoreductase [Alphaproteobacteria bacterium]|nr:Gfo/Idh/MocA family oxidoreductase [Alphaproteobacteria bacterium]
MSPTIAFVGIAHWHAPIYLDCLSRIGIRVVGASDLDAEAGRAASARLGLDFTPDAADMLARARPDFVFVTPRHDRALDELAPVLDRRLPFLIEKPMGVDGRIAAEVARRTAAAGVWAAPALPNRLLEIWDRLARLEAAGRLGALLHASFRLINGPPGRYRTMHHVPWMLDPAIGGGGALRNLGMHGADAILRLARGATPALAAARTTRHGFRERVEEYATAVMTLPDGAVMQVEAGYSWAPSSGGDFEWRIAATGAYLQQTKGLLVVREAGGAIETLETEQPSYLPMVDRVLADFGAGRPPFATLAECAAATDLCDRIYAEA